MRKKIQRYNYNIFLIAFALSLIYIPDISGQTEVEYRRKRGRSTRTGAANNNATNKRPSFAPAPTTAMPQITGITGMVIDAETSEPLPEATIQIIAPENLNKGTLTDFEGRFTLDNIRIGIYTLKIDYIGYESLTIPNVKVERGVLTRVNVVLRDEAKAIETVVIESELRQTSDAALLSIQRNSVQITDGVSSDMIVKETPDFQTSFILRRMPGVVFIEDRYLVIRGMFERYNLTTINASPTPVSEFERYTFDYNTIPASLIKSVQMIKTASADQFADFAGGLINFQFQDIPEQNSLKANVQLFYNNQTTGKDFYRYQGNTFAAGGIFTAYRHIPSNFPTPAETRQYDLFGDANIAASKQLTLNAATIENTALPSQNFNLVWQKRLKIAGQEAGFSAALNFLNLSQNFISYRRVPDTLQSSGEIPRLIDSYTGFYRSEKTQNLNLIFNAGMRLGNKGRLVWHHLFSNGLQQIAARDSGAYYEAGDGNYYPYHYYSQRHAIYRLYSTQLAAEYHFKPKLQTKFRAFYNGMRREEPANWGYGYEPNEQGQYGYVDYNNYATLRPSSTTEHIVGANASVITLDIFKDFFKGKFERLEFGVYGSTRVKSLDARRIKIVTAGFVDGETNLPEELLLENRKAELFTTDNIRADGILMQEVTDSTDNYQARTLKLAPYLMADFRLGKHITINAGLRLENFHQKMEVAGVFTNANYTLAERTHNDLLPSINARYAFTDKLNFRLCGSQTLSRPDPKDLSPYKYLNYINSTRVIGNPDLQRAKISNIDARIEYFPTGLELMTFSIFYKYFDNPIIQQMVSDATVTSLDIIPVNNPAAQAIGVEVELRRSIGNLLKIDGLQNLVAYGNFAVMRSTDLSGNFMDLWKSEQRPMQGLAPVVINAGLIFQEPRTKVNIAAFYNRSGQRVAVVGTAISPDIYELPRDMLDIQVSRAIGRNFNIRLAVLDVFQQPLSWVQMYNGRTDFNPDLDREIYSNKRGFQIMLGLTANF